jgi:group I intron endonuclease
MTFIYKITNIINNKSYIGLTKRNPKERWWEHSKPSRNKVSALTNAINKYGKENFKFEVIYETENPNLMERYFIRLNNTISPNGYNLTFGGENPVFTEEECIRRSERRKKQAAPVQKGSIQNDEWVKKRIASRQKTINNRIASGLPAFKKRASNG